MNATQKEEMRLRPPEAMNFSTLMKVQEPPQTQQALQQLMPKTAMAVRILDLSNIVAVGSKTTAQMCT